MQLTTNNMEVKHQNKNKKLFQSYRCHVIHSHLNIVNGARPFQNTSCKRTETYYNIAVYRPNEFSFRSTKQNNKTKGTQFINAFSVGNAKQSLSILSKTSRCSMPYIKNEIKNKNIEFSYYNKLVTQKQYILY